MIDAFASEPHYAAHLLPVWQGLPDEVRGTFFVLHRSKAFTDTQRVVTRTGRPKGSGPLLVAGGRDSVAYHRRPRIMLEHGAGQTYPGCNRLVDSPSYSGGQGHDGTILFLCPSETVAGRWRARYPVARSAVVGCPRLDRWHNVTPLRVVAARPIVCVSFHWDAGALCPEAGWAFLDFQREVSEMAEREDFEILGHGHPRAFGQLRPWYEKQGIEAVQDFEEVLERADLYAVDNSSTAMEFASTGRPIVWMNSPTYRRDVSHGGRFWDWERAGLGAEPGKLAETVRMALDDPPAVRTARERVVSQVYTYRDGTATRRAVREVLAACGAA